jgi:hypothetical protein
MPNWCYNKLYLESQKPIESIVLPYTKKDEKFSSLKFLFEEIVPIPKELHIPATWTDNADDEYHEQYKANVAKYGYRSWYDFCIANWGTKWNGIDGGFNEDMTVFMFETAWSPPIPIIKKLANEHNPDNEAFILEYLEEGFYFCGKYSASKEGDHHEYYNVLTDAPQQLLDSLGYTPQEVDECIN